MHNFLQIALTPLAVFWVTFSSLFAAARFVNNLREMVITGKNGSNNLSIRHRSALKLDWCLSMTGIVVAAFLYAGIISWSSRVISASVPGRTYLVILAIAIYPLLAGASFIICGISDFKLMNEVLSQEKAKSNQNAASASA